MKYTVIYIGRNGGLIRETAATLNKAKTIALNNKYAFLEIRDANNCQVYGKILEKADGSHYFAESDSNL